MRAAELRSRRRLRDLVKWRPHVNSASGLQPDDLPTVAHESFHVSLLSHPLETTSCFCRLPLAHPRSAAIMAFYQVPHRPTSFYQCLRHMRLGETATTRVGCAHGAGA